MQSVAKYIHDAHDMIYSLNLQKYEQQYIISAFLRQYMRQDIMNMTQKKCHSKSSHILTIKILQHEFLSPS